MLTVLLQNNYDSPSFQPKNTHYVGFGLTDNNFTLKLILQKFMKLTVKIVEHFVIVRE